MTTKRYFTYMVECSDGTYYTGYTTDLEKRVKAHNEGKTGAKYTRARRPVKLIYYEEYDNLHDAMSREVRIKQLTRRQKEELRKRMC
ncbi:MAG: GIY-YIG nuclease family protein [Lachnospiraceae bacterium]|nr:GIY-YIG nuclease family protein [Lachnospiraceae bacterium]MBQ5484884.1 GIY-YIG nuclease family protein [Lachnospiraceae bacterium]